MVNTFELRLHGTAYLHECLHPFIGAGAEQNLPANGMGLDTIRGVDGSPYSTVFRAFERSDVANNHLTSVEANAHGELGQVQLTLLGVESQDAHLHREPTRLRPLGALHAR